MVNLPRVWFPSTAVKRHDASVVCGVSACSQRFWVSLWQTNIANGHYTHTNPEKWWFSIVMFKKSQRLCGLVGQFHPPCCSTKGLGQRHGVRFFARGSCSAFFKRSCGSRRWMVIIQVKQPRWGICVHVISCAMYIDMCIYVYVYIYIYYLCYLLCIYIYYIYIYIYICVCIGIYMYIYMYSSRTR